jgi:hypothetical protein
MVKVFSRPFPIIFKPRRHRELCIGWNHGGRQCWGLRKLDETPKYMWSWTPEQIRESTQEHGDKESLKVSTRLKSCESLYTCPWAPFYRRRKNFYISRLPSNLKNISDVNMYLIDLYNPWSAELISYIYKPATSSHLEPRLLRQHLWPGLPLTFDPSFMKIANHQDLWTELQNPQPKRSSLWPLKFPASQFPELAKFPSSLNEKQTYDPMLIRWLFRTILRVSKLRKK